MVAAGFDFEPAIFFSVSSNKWKVIVVTEIVIVVSMVVL
jgi:hypothetical protein